MSLIIEAPREVEAALIAKAARLGVPVERYALGVLRRDVESNGAQSTVESEAKPRGFLALLDASAPRIAAGVLHPISSDAITQAIADARP